VTYTIGVTIAGPSSATGVVLTDPLPSTAAFVSAQPAREITPSQGVVVARLSIGQQRDGPVTITVTRQ